jgi:hypothetical protein
LRLQSRQRNVSTERLIDPNCVIVVNRPYLSMRSWSMIDMLLHRYLTPAQNLKRRRRRYGEVSAVLEKTPYGFSSVR